MEELKSTIKSKHMMLYECEACGSIYMMFLEEGLEEHIGRSSKPVPFCIRCHKCGDIRCHHVFGHDIKFANYRDIPSSNNIFKNVKYSTCGIPVVGHRDFINRSEYIREVGYELCNGRVPEKLSFQFVDQPTSLDFVLNDAYGLLTDIIAAQIIEYCNVDAKQLVNAFKTAINVGNIKSVYGVASAAVTERMVSDTVSDNRENRRHKSEKWKKSRYKRKPDKKYF